MGGGGGRFGRGEVGGVKVGGVRVDLDVFCENSKKKWGGVRVDVNEELKFL